MSSKSRKDLKKYRRVENKMVNWAMVCQELFPTCIQLALVQVFPGHRLSKKTMHKMEEHWFLQEGAQTVAASSAKEDMSC